jgi:DNA-binding Xre family transcriptional regulator
VVTGKRRLTINWAVVEQHRIAAGLSHTELIAQVGPCASAGPRRLWRDTDHDGVRLGLLERLCAVLDLHSAELFTPPPRRVAARIAARVTGTDRPATVWPDSGDVAVAEAAIGTLTAPVSPDRLADALGWPFARLMAALDGLDTALEHSGSRVATDGHYLLGLRPRHDLLPQAQHPRQTRRCPRLRRGRFTTWPRTPTGFPSRAGCAASKLGWFR